MHNCDEGCRRIGNGRRSLAISLDGGMIAAGAATSCSTAWTRWFAPDNSGFYYESIDLFDASIRRPLWPTDDGQSPAGPHGAGGCGGAPCG